MYLSHLYWETGLKDTTTIERGLWTFFLGPFWSFGRTVTVTVTRNCFVRDNLVNSGSVPEPVVICGEKCPDWGTAGLASRYTQPGRVLATAFGTTD